MEIGMTLLGQALSFVLLIWFTMKFVWPHFMVAIEDRQKRISEGLAAADRSQRDLAQAQEQVDAVVREARVKATEIIDQAHVRASQMIDTAKNDAIAEAGRQRALAEAEITAAANRAKEELRRHVSALAVAGASRLIKREIDPNAHKALLDELAAEI